MSGKLFQSNSHASRIVRSGFLPLIIYCSVLALTISCTSPPATNSSGQGNRQPSGQYQSSSNCKLCHAHIYEQFIGSMHAKSYKNPLFKAEFFDILMPRFENDKKLSGEVKGCIACHSPITFLQNKGNISGFADVNPRLSGVECDLCHTIDSFKGSKPENGNYVSWPSRIKLGPFNYKNDHHRAYAELQTKSEVCAVCHSRTNRYGLEIISTFSEWKESQFAEKGIECQDCHMNAQGFLTKGEPIYESGEAAQGSLINPKNREKIYTHRFPGAHSESQVTGAIQLDIQVDESTLQPGKEVLIFVNVDNSRSGHKLPTGSAELRLLYLDLVAEINGKTIPLTTNTLDKGRNDIAGKGKFDAAVLGSDVPDGRRVYRAICVDENGQQTLYSFDAAKIAFDNRLQASEIRKEFFTFKVPHDIGAEFSLIAKLYYLRYPSNFAETLGVPQAKPVELASTHKKIVMN